MTTESQIATRAMLARLSITQWSARKADKSATDKVHADNGAADDAGRYNKALVSKHALAEINKIAGEARALHYKMTLPWKDDGARILSAKAWQEYSDKLRDMHNQFDAAADAFVSLYEEHVSNARGRLNGLFSEADYPAARDIRARYSFGISIDPLPTADDFRVELSDAQTADIRAQIAESMKAATATAMRDAWQRIAEHVGHMAERLRAFTPGADGTKASGVFHDSLVGNVRELARLLPALNIANDPALSRIAERMERELSGHDADALRKGDTLRESVASAAEAILKDVSDYMA